MFAANFFAANYFQALFFAVVPAVASVLTGHGQTVTFSKGVAISINSKANVMVRSNSASNTLRHSK